MPAAARAAVLQAMNKLLLHPAAKPLVFALALGPFAWLLYGALANRLGETYAENESRLLGGTPAESKQRFIEHVNLRAGEYADFSYDEHGPDYTFMRYLAFCMSPIMDAKDSHWIIDQIISIEAPEAVKMVDKTLRDVHRFGFASLSKMKDEADKQVAEWERKATDSWFKH